MTAPDKDINSLISELDEEFGKKKRQGKREPRDIEIAQARNKAFHAANVPLDSSAGGERPDPEDSQAWKPIHLVTYIMRQRCETCMNTVEYIAGEYVRFQSIHQFGGTILRRSEHCPDLFLYRRSDNPLEEVFEEHFQTVSRCPGCIAVERQAQAIWDAFLQDQRLELPGQQFELPGFNEEACK